MPRRRPDRLVGVDAARGVALLGMVAVHVLPTLDRDGTPTLVGHVFGGRSAALFAVLAGVGVGLAYRGARPPARGTAADDPRTPRFSTLRAAAALSLRAVLIGALGLAL